MNYQQAQKLFYNTLSEKLTQRELKNTWFLILESITKKSKVTLLTKKNEWIFSEKELAKLTGYIAELRNNKPLAYILGKSNFYGLDIIVNKHTLIPRPETEELVAEIITNHKTKATTRIIDLCSGSGCIALALKKELKNSTVIGVEKNRKAVEIAKANALALNLSVDFICEDIFSPAILSHSHQCVDVIVSNPPYIPVREKNSLEKNVVNYEPKEALFVDDNNPIKFYERIALLGLKWLKKNGVIYFEINPLYHTEIIQLLKNFSYKKTQSITDLNGKVRIVKAVNI